MRILSDTVLEDNAPEKITKTSLRKSRRKSHPNKIGDEVDGGWTKKAADDRNKKKLNRQKYLEYKYEAKDILNDPNVPEEHRSNLLGQIWAKGERQSVDESLDYIESKEEELILPNNVADQLRELVKRMTTKR